MKNFRTLIACLAVLPCFSYAGNLSSSSDGEVKFAVISDIHNDIMHDGPKRLNDFMADAAKNDVDFIIELGDFCHVKESNRYFVNLWNSFPGEKYHVLGNHDMDVCDKVQYQMFVGIKDRYYSFDKGDFRFIVLDANNLYTDGKYIPYAYGNFYVDMSKREFIDPEQIEWLKKEIRYTDKKCIIFSHQCLENTVGNREEIRRILEEENKAAGFKKVVAAFSGHDHTNYEKVINGIAYIQINSASNQWVGDQYKCESRFSKEINEKNPYLKFVTPWEESIYAIVTVDSEGLKLKGKESKFISPTPEEMKIPKDMFPYPLVPYIKDFNFKF